MRAFPIDLPDLGPTCIEIVPIPEEEFDMNFVDSHENLYNAQVRTSKLEGKSIVESEEEEFERDEGGGGLEDMVWPPEMLGAAQFYSVQRR